MPKSFEQSLDEIARLVSFYRVNRTAWSAPLTLEADARQSLIDPFFVALDWDVHNTDGAALKYRPVIFEESREIEGTRKAPDYTFRIGGERKFFAEAKKPRVSIGTDREPAYQLRRYGWSASLPLSLLTDFEELAVYDCRIMPKLADTARTARLRFFEYEQYPDVWREIWDVFSFPAVRGGSFDQYVEKRLSKRGVIPVDAQILQDIEGWRKLLASNLALRNKTLSTDDLNDAVQKTLDRILFLRIAEDRGIEPYEQLLKTTQRENIYAELVRRFRLADTKYNSGLFDFSRAGDTLTPKLAVDDATLKEVISHLYLPHSAYEFQILPVEILGNVYEQFLGKVIHLTAAHQARIEDKPEVRKAGGVYYTPSYIVDYIVKQTVGKAVEDKTPEELLKFRVLDMACGSGSFLLGAYQFLLDWYLKWYTENPAPKKKQEQRIIQGGNGEWRLTTAERKRILTTHVFGVDIDRQAVEVTKLSLLLKVLEGESEESLQPTLAGLGERALPNLDANIKCGNSLIGPDYFGEQMFPTAEELKRVNPFDWKHEFPEVMRDGGFDCVIGNPPYGADLDSGAKKYISTHFESTQYKFDSFGFFIEAGVRLLANKGRLGFIVPNSWLNIKTFSRLRYFLLENTRIDELVNLGKDVFAANVDTMLLFLANSHSNRNTIRSVDASNNTLNELRMDAPNRSFTIPQSAWAQDPEYKFNVLITEAERSIFEKMRSQSLLLGSFTESSQGLIPYNTKEMSQKNPFISNRKQGKEWKPFLDKGACIGRYSLQWNGLFIKFGDWLYTANKPKFYESEKILIQRHRNPSLSRRLVASLDTEQYYFKDNLCCIISTAESEFALTFLLGILNSGLMNLYYKRHFTEVSLNPIYLRQLPIVNLRNDSRRAQYNKMVTLVERMLSLHKRLATAPSDAERAVLQRQIEATDAQIDALVYELYELTPEEIEIVERK